MQLKNPAFAREVCPVVKGMVKKTFCLERRNDDGCFSERERHGNVWKESVLYKRDPVRCLDPLSALPDRISCSEVTQRYPELLRRPLGYCCPSPKKLSLLRAYPAVIRCKACANECDQEIPLYFPNIFRDILCLRRIACI